MLNFKNLSKSFGSQRIIRSATGNLGVGTYALQGSNGSGKSTLLALFAGALTPDAGDVLIDGLSLTRTPVAARRRLSYAPDESPVYTFITGRDFLDFVAKAKQCAVRGTVVDHAEEWGLSAYLSTRFGAMSLGTQKKFLLCAAWIGEAPVILLDEPSNGLDEVARRILARRIAERASNGLVLFVSHDAAFIDACHARILRIEELLGEPAHTPA
ncbi:MAG: ABC transporter ATP-binding protein [Janthinobacterium lividum]